MFQLSKGNKFYAKDTNLSPIFLYAMHFCMLCGHFCGAYFANFLKTRVIKGHKRAEGLERQKDRETEKVIKGQKGF